MDAVWGQPGTHGVTSTSFPARKGSRMQRSGNLSLSCGRPICAPCTVSAQGPSAMKSGRERGPPQTLPVSRESTESRSDEQEDAFRTHRGILNRLVVVVDPPPWERGVTSIRVERLCPSVNKSRVYSVRFPFPGSPSEPSGRPLTYWLSKT